ncbi:MAG TPA: phosphoribulokinase [Gemmatimonadaceae bacterium]|jgi:phosphoribulokinase|nr:phosphoribulokinase [Gemmatimonadaceae bacterium]
MAAPSVLIGVVGDSGSGKTTISAAIAQRLGVGRVTALCLDDYHRYDRAERMRRDITALAPDCNRLDLMAQHLAALRRGETVVKPVYNHTNGTFGPDERVTPRAVVIARGLLGLSTEALRSTFDLTVYLDPAETLRVHWKCLRDCAKRGYTPEEVLKHLSRRRPDAERYVHPQRAFADVVIRYEPRGSALGDAPLALRVEERSRAAQPVLLEAVLAAAERARWPLASDVPRAVAATASHVTDPGRSR